MLLLELESDIAPEEDKIGQSHLDY